MSSNGSSLRRIAPSLLAILFVIGAYVFFASAGTWEFRRVAFTDTHYANLTEGFRRGQLSMAIEPVPELVRLPDPYDVDARARAQAYFVWDASYYKGKYYLYFSPLPALLVYLPFRLVAGGYPRDALVAVVFSTWAFLMAAWIVRRYLSPFWLLLIGLGNVLPYTLTNVRVYEVTVTLGMALTATWAYAMLRFLETRAVRHAAWLGFWLALAIVTRPNLGMLLLPAAVAILIARERRAAVAALMPLIVIGALAAWYNVARFGNPLEFGMRYQMNERSMLHGSMCGLCSGPELRRFATNARHYLFSAPVISGAFPFVDLPVSRTDHSVSYPSDEQVGGVVPLIPLVVVATFLALVLVARRTTIDVELRAGMLTLAAGWLVLFGLATCGAMTPRYPLDFMMLMAVGSVVCVQRVRLMPFRVAAIAMACYSAVLGFALGFAGPEKSFATANPELFQRLATLFN